NVFGADEVALLPAAVRAVMDAVDVPLCLDSTNPRALDAALKVCTGRPLINTVTGEERSLEGILPLVKQYGAAVIGLTQDEAGVAGNADTRMAVARKIVERARSAGIPDEDVVIDCLALSLGADPASAQATIEAIRRIKADLGVNLTLGASNVSFGLPDRKALDKAFLSICMAAGVNCPIVDAAAVRQTVLAADLILGRDKRARRYIGVYRERAKR
ncbi:MAG: dihydropteroate synthase, partial [Dehalococcoidia bacterium]|nr:dihydropteroate synthase [Dehalococcoidia bacterium]